MGGSMSGAVADESAYESMNRWYSSGCCLIHSFKRSMSAGDGVPPGDVTTGGLACVGVVARGINVAGCDEGVAAAAEAENEDFFLAALPLFECGGVGASAYACLNFATFSSFSSGIDDPRRGPGLGAPGPLEWTE